MMQPLWKSEGNFSDFKQFSLCLYPKEVKAATETCLCSDILSNFIHNGQKVETTQVFAGGWMNQQTVVYSYSRILFKMI